MSRVWCILFLGGWLAWSGGAAGPGAVIRIDLGTIDRAVSTALNESDVLQKMAEEAAKKKANAKPIKGISRLKDLRPPAISLMLSPGLGLFMAVLVQMTITGKSCFIGGNMEIALAANLTASSRLWQDATDIPRFSSRNCHIALVSVKTKVPSSVLPEVMSKFLDSTLQKVLPCLLCPAVDAVLNRVNAKFTTMTSEIPLGTARTLQYALLNPPLTSETFIELDLKTILHQKEGKEVGLPMDRSSLASLPPKRDAATQLILSANFLSAELSILQTSFNLEISNNMVLGLPPLVTTMLGALIPKISRVLPPSQPVMIEMREEKAPVVTITPDKSLVQLFSTAEFWVSPSDSAPESLFVLDIHSNLEVQFAIAEEKLLLSLALQSLSRVALASSSLGMFDELPLKGVLADIIHVAYVPLINSCEWLCQENRLPAVLHPWGLQWVLEEGNASWSGLRHAHSFRGRRWLPAHSRATAKGAGFSPEAPLNVVPVLKIKITCHEQPGCCAEGITYQRTSISRFERIPPPVLLECSEAEVMDLEIMPWQLDQCSISESDGVSPKSLSAQGIHKAMTPN
ncbi:BPI fold-containing family B member 6 [Harpia harpyja]|uniref:BPI fold-containing family B member 6 n=1 Tax=Harpia harpyja TaxID=202280 RepID=UPI0022B11B33|nr:BPI fold-containing family B member 6 [Harpia harpyja]